MKRNCNGCRALNHDKCSLGYKTTRIDVSDKFRGLNLGRKPIEECPKPKTYEEYFALKG